MPGNMQAPGRSADRSPVKSRKGRAIPVGQGPVAQGLVQSGQGSAGRGGFMSPGSNAKHAMLPVIVPSITRHRSGAARLAPNGNAGIVSHNNTNTPFSCPPRHQPSIGSRGASPKRNSCAPAIQSNEKPSLSIFCGTEFHRHKGNLSKRTMIAESAKAGACAIIGVGRMGI